MLNPNFPPEVLTADAESVRNYVLPERPAARAQVANRSFDSGEREYRLDPVYTSELWQKIGDLGLERSRWERLDVLDVCSGAGFLSYHLLRRCEPRSLTCLDISHHEVAAARALLDPREQRTRIEFRVDDVLNLDPKDGQFDVVIGNSFLHHFPDVGRALERLCQVLRPGGVFAPLHEPTPTAIALESRNPMRWIQLARSGEKLVDQLRQEAASVGSSAGADVWLFEKDDLQDLCLRAGFRSVGVVRSHLLRPLVCAVASIQPRAERPELANWQRTALAWSGAVDRRLRAVLPSGWYGSVSIAARR